jgi:SPP1 gp7 family putative phage head morphogenesis protein
MNREEEFIQSLYDEANEQLKQVYKEQKQNRDELLNELAMIMLTYTILDGLMRLKSDDKSKEHKRLSTVIVSSMRGQGATQEKVLQDILNSTVNRTFDFYSYNASLKDVRKIIESNFKGKHFSERVWDNEEEVAKHLHKQVKEFLDGKINVNQIKKDIERTYNTNAYNAKRIVETEINRSSASAFDKFCIETGVKKVKYNATLDSKLCSDCAQYHDKVFELKDKIDIPRHPLCRCFYTVED